MGEIGRQIRPLLLAALQDTPAVMLVGPRQAGKSTLVQSIARTEHPARYLTLDDLRTLAAAENDPIGLIEQEQGPVVIDEIQRAPQLLLPIKAAIDRNRRPGRFILTGSAQVMLLPRVAESLAGRVEVHTLWPFSQAEIEGAPGRIVELLLGERGDAESSGEVGEHESAPTCSRAELIERIVRGGFPSAIGRSDERREHWFASYLTTLVQRDLRELANIERLTQIPAILALLATRARAPLNRSELSGSLGIPRSSLERYLTLLEHTFLVHRVPAFHSRHVRQIAKAPKLLVADSALLTNLLHADRRRLADDPALLGCALECFVGMELAKQLAASSTRAVLTHMRTARGEEVDFVLQAPDGRVAAVEVKATATVRTEDFRHLARLRDRLGNERFRRGVVLYAGSECLPFGKRLEAWPLSMLWRAWRVAVSGGAAGRERA
jgi:predicted AAA+ superfamily ATPase